MGTYRVKHLHIVHTVNTADIGLCMVGCAWGVPMHWGHAANNASLGAVVGARSVGIPGGLQQHMAVVMLCSRLQFLLLIRTTCATR